ncbi:MAG: DUF4340 domain-containing protein [Planctomycetota bacterium]
MNENTKTIGFVAVAVVVALVVFISRPRLREPASENAIPAELFADFDDPLEAASLEIVKFNEETATLRPFKVAQVNNQWSIPSHENYPADAKDQLAKAAAGLVGLKPLDVASDSPRDHEIYGVVDPDPQKLQPGDTGVGTRVEMRNRADEVLLSLIIGKEVPDRSELRYVRVAGKDPVYTVKLNIDKLTTKFEDWIEKDLLKLNTMDVRQAQINDYSYDPLTRKLDPRSRMTLDYDDGESKWKLSEDKTAGEQDWVDREMAEDEELNTSKLNDMKWALDDLKIVDVARKPEGLRANLKDAGALKLNGQDVRSLGSRGFHIERNQLLSSEGEVTVLMKDGVHYVLRFGQMAGSGDEEDAEEEEKATEGEEAEQKDDAEEAGVNRYLFVMAEFNPDAIAKPELEPLPEKEAAAEGEGPAAEPAEGETPKEPAEGEEKPSEEATPENADAEKTADEENSDLDKERERIEKENKRKQEEYDEKIKKGKEHVEELNGRFADWYYVISNEVYQKIHLSREDVVKKKEKDDEEKAGPDEPQADKPEEQGDTPADFEALKQEGVGTGEE